MHANLCSLFNKCPTHYIFKINFITIDLNIFGPLHITSAGTTPAQYNFKMVHSNFDVFYSRTALFVNLRG